MRRRADCNTADFAQLPLRRHGEANSVRTSRFSAGAEAIDTGQEKE
jgi:hypothetical protein